MLRCTSRWQSFNSRFTVNSNYGHPLRALCPGRDVCPALIRERKKSVRKLSAFAVMSLLAATGLAHSEGIDRLIAASSQAANLLEHDKEHGGQHGHAESAHDEMLGLPGSEAPTLELLVEDGPSAGYTLRLATTNFRFSEEHVDTDHVHGEGHGHFYVNGKKLSRVYTPTYTLASLPPGVNEVKIGLFTNNHLAYAADGWPVSARIVFLVLETDDRPLPVRKPERIDLAIKQGRVDADHGTVRVDEGDLVELRWSADERLIVHLHGYDIDTEVAPRAPAALRFDAVLTGRFPVEIHGGREHRPLIYLEVYPK